MFFKFFRTSQKKKRPSVRFLPIDRQVSFKEPTTLLNLANRNKVDLASSCDGNGSCGTCRVVIQKGLEALPRRGAIESEWAEERHWLENERLACQIPAQDGLVVWIPPLGN